MSSEVIPQLKDYYPGCVKRATCLKWDKDPSSNVVIENEYREDAPDTLVELNWLIEHGYNCLDWAFTATCGDETHVARLKGDQLIEYAELGGVPMWIYDIRVYAFVRGNEIVVLAKDYYDLLMYAKSAGLLRIMRRYPRMINHGIYMMMKMTPLIDLAIDRINRPRIDSNKVLGDKYLAKVLLYAYDLADYVIDKVNKACSGGGQAVVDLKFAEYADLTRTLEASHLWFSHVTELIDKLGGKITRTYQELNTRYYDYQAIFNCEEFNKGIKP